MKNLFSHLSLSRIQQIKNKKFYYLLFLAMIVTLLCKFMDFPQVHRSFTTQDEIESKQLFTEHIDLLEKKVNTLCRNVMIIKAASEFSEHYSHILARQQAKNNNAAIFNITSSNKEFVSAVNKNEIATDEYWHIYNRFHPVLKAYAEKFDILDITIIDPDKSFVLYSVNQQPYTLKATKNKVFENTQFANLIKEVNNRSIISQILPSEFTGDSHELELYVASPVCNNNVNVGFLVFRFTLNQFKGSLALQSYLE